MAQRFEQRMLLQPRMLQSIEILQLSTVELAQLLREAADSNEALAIEEREHFEPAFSARDHRRPSANGRELTDRHDEMLQNAPDRSKSLSELVLESLAITDIEPELEPWVRFLVGCLDDVGWLSTPDERLLELAAEAGLGGDAGTLGRAIAALQRLEPRGIGGRGPIEALLLQLDPAGKDYGLLCRLLEEFLEDLARNKLPRVAHALGVDLDELHALLEELRALEPRPAAALRGESARPITPDVVVEATPGVERGFDVRVERSDLPAVTIDGGIAALARDRTQPPDVRRYVRAKLTEARWLVEAVEGRKATLLRVARAVFAEQGEFLELGPGHLVPLTMSALAEELGLAVSTVSRAVAEKHVETPWGVFALRHFFQSVGGGDEGVAREGVGELMRAVFAGEDKAVPLSDDAVVAAMAEKGFKIARRTVAKYRAELGIPSSYRRREHKG